MILAQMRTLGREIATGYGSIIFLDSPWIGLGLLAASFIQPNSAICGLTGIISALALLHWLGLEVGTLRRLVLYNSLLTGLFVGYLFKLDLFVIGVALAATCLCVLLTSVLDSFFRSQSLPVLSLPFAITAITLALSKSQFSNLTDATPYFIEHSISHLHASSFWNAFNIFLRSMGSIFCIPDPLFGAAVIGLIFLRSPFLGLIFVSGFLLGFSWESILRMESLESMDALGTHYTHYFNYSLVFTATALIALAPSRLSLGLAVIGTILTSFVALASLSFWGIFRIPIVPFPFNFTALLLIIAVRWIRPDNAKVPYLGTPEATLDQARLFRLRQRRGEIGLFCPFQGTWVVQQGFNGEWTHRGYWKHALDFVIHGDDGKTFKNKGYELEDYHCFGKPILAPVEGTITALCNDRPDNPIGTLDNQNNWGNYIILRSVLGYFVVLAHLKQNSVTVAVGDPVLPGAALALCGNSGYSQEPHLHLQTQWTAIVGGYTVPFHLLNYRIFNQTPSVLFFQGLPATGDQVEPFSKNLPLDRAMAFKIGDIHRFRVTQPNSVEREIAVTVKLDENLGSIYLNEGENRLYFGRAGAQAYFYGFQGNAHSPLADLFIAAPRIPLIYGAPAEFEDALPLQLSVSKLGRYFWLFKELVAMPGSPLKHDPSLIHYQSTPDELEIRSLETFLKLDPSYGILQFKNGVRSYDRLV